MKIFNLYKNNCLKLKEKSCKISCQKGVIWITFKGGKDIILKNGENIKIKGKNLILQGIEDSRFIMESA